MSHPELADFESIPEQDLAQLRQSEWHDNAGFLYTPVYHAVQQAAQLVYNDHQPETMGKLLSLPGKFTEEQRQNSLQVIFNLTRRTPKINASDFSHIAVRESKIARCKADPNLIHPRYITDEDILQGLPEEKADDRCVILPPGVVTTMPFIIDAGRQVGELSGTIFGWSFFQAKVIPRDTGQYISVSYRYGIERIWDSATKLRLAAKSQQIEESRGLAHILQAWNMAHPYEGGAVGLGKRS